MVPSDPWNLPVARPASNSPSLERGGPRPDALSLGRFVISARPRRDFPHRQLKRLHHPRQSKLIARARTCLRPFAPLRGSNRYRRSQAASTLPAWITHPALAALLPGPFRSSPSALRDQAARDQQMEPVAESAGENSVSPISSPLPLGKSPLRVPPSGSKRSTKPA